MKRFILTATIALLEYILLTMNGWRPTLIRGRGDGQLWFWKSPSNGHILSRTLAYELQVTEIRRKKTP